MDKSTSGTIEQFSLVSKHRFLLMILAVIIVSSILVASSMALYYRSGAAQLDLSRPGYKDVRSQVVNGDDFQDYSSSGPVNQAAVNQFETFYSEQAKKTESVDAFGGDPLSPESLGIDLVSAEQ